MSAPDRTAIIYENDESTDVKRITYKELLQKTCRVASLYKVYGCKKGNRITVYMPMILEVAYVILASSSIGAVQSVVFAGFSAQSLKDRIADVQSTLVVTANEGLRRKKVMALKSIIDAAIADLPFVSTCLVFRHTDAKTARTLVRDVWANDKAAKMRLYCLPEMTSCSCCTPLVTQGSQRNGAHHGVVSSVDVAHSEDCFRFSNGTAIPPPRTLAGSLATPTSSADPSRTDVQPSCSSRCPRTRTPGRYWDMIQVRARACAYGLLPTATVDGLEIEAASPLVLLERELPGPVPWFSVASLGPWVVIRDVR